MSWRPICPIDRLEPDRGVAALVEGTQVAIFRLSDGGGLYALSNIDPFSGVACLSRGIVGDVTGEPMVASPVFKQRFSLRTGACLDDATVRVDRYDARVTDGIVEVCLPVRERAAS
ncbi:MAG TPA: nitrite reductase small subunit NirD [Acidimicrobiales bacterium]|jgi:nitrite reductase (NADH) small subunit|nr:nitrite reductase small subunit NirD [Acidimicrobiales bacterium]